MINYIKTIINRIKNASPSQDPNLFNAIKAAERVPDSPEVKNAAKSEQ
jgi:hypothetical protein